MPTTPTLYCAPCTSDLALVREAVTFVSGTASCAAHAVLLTHPHDNPGRRRARLSQLRQLAESKAETALPEEQAALELLVHEYTLAGAMDMGGQPRPDGSPRRERGERAPGDRAPGGQPGQPGHPGQPGEPGEGRSKRGRRGRDRDRPRADREPGALPEGGPSDPAVTAPTTAEGSAPSATPAESAAPTAPSTDAPSSDAPATGAPSTPAPTTDAPSAPADAPAPSAPAESSLPAGTSADGAPAPTADGTPAAPPAEAAPSTPAPPAMPEIVPASSESTSSD